MPDTPIQDHSALGAARLRDPELARRNLARIAARVPPGVMQAIVSLLPEVPDADGALNLFERLAEHGTPDLFRSLDRNRALVHYALIVFGYSAFLGETLIQNPDVFVLIGRERALDRSHSRDELRETFARWQSRSFETDLAVLLARFKRREYIRIMLRDVLGIATLAETTAEISALADVLIGEAMTQVASELHHRYGGPQHVAADERIADTPAAVLSLGKLGGNELNYSSDIDLFFLFGEGEDAGSSAISGREYFIRLAQGVSEALSRHTREGSAFRVDLRLRPQGGEGEPAVDLGHALRYYGEVAHDWELQAMIKARHSAGDLALARRFIRGVQPFVYKPELNLAAIETALETRDRISARRRAASAREGIDVKLDRGGIRDIEFLVQCLQRVYGGQEHWLRSGGTLFSLQKLHDKGHISGSDFHELTTAYEFLRTIEHRLQLRRGQQTHRLPGNAADLEILARSIGRLPTSEAAPSDIAAMLRRRMEAVSDIYRRIIYRQQAEIERDAGEFRLQTPALDLGREPSDHQIMSRLAAEAPQLAEIVAGARLGIQGRRNLFRFLAAAFTTAERYAAVLRSPRGLQNALEVFELSEFLTSTLVRHPEEIATLEDLGAHKPGEIDDLFDMDEVVQPPPWWSLAPGEPQEKYARLRREFRRAVFASAARDVVAKRSVRQSFFQTTTAAERAIAAALGIAGVPPGLAVLALGRLGTHEFDLLSDADLIFVRDSSADHPASCRAAEHIMEALSAYTREGSAFAVDARLRPRGSEGELVVTPAQLQEYFRAEAQPWEALTYTKLRFVAGDEKVGAAATSAGDILRERFAADAEFPAAVRAMRARLEKQDDGFNLKTAPGGLYDIEFLAAALAIRRRMPSQVVELRRRLHDLREADVLSASDAALLVDAAGLLQSVEHAIRIATGRARKELSAAEHARYASETLTNWFTGRSFREGVEAELRRTMPAVREVFERLL